MTFGRACPATIVGWRLVLGLATACLAVSGTAAEPNAESAAAVAAGLLARVDGAAGTGTSRRAIAADLQALDRLGVHPVETADVDPEMAWRKAARVPPKPVFRGRLLGPAYRRGWIDPGQIARTEQQFLAGQRATLAVATNPATALALTVEDPNQIDVCKGGSMHCSWYPEFTQRYTISLRNAGSRRVRFYLVVE